MKSPIPKLFLLGAIALSVSGAAVPADAMNITFVGDSITQGGSFLAGNVASYRYSLFKHFVDNNIDYNPMGTTVGAAKNVDVSALTPDYRGVTFSNVSEAAASGRSYQYSGHEAGSGYREDPDVVYPIENRGPVTIKLGLENPYTGTANTFYDGTALKTYTGATYQSLYGNEKVETLCVMIGINDLYDGNSNSDILKHVEEIVKAYQTHNPNVRVHLFELLPTAANNGTGTNHKNNYFRTTNNSATRGKIGAQARQPSPSTTFPQDFTPKTARWWTQTPEPTRTRKANSLSPEISHAPSASGNVRQGLPGAPARI